MANQSQTKPEMMKDELLYRISIDPSVRSGAPCIRGHKITVAQILDFLTNGWSFEEVCTEYPQLEHEDIRACIAFDKQLKRKR